jgi:hypothetical protein
MIFKQNSGLFLEKTNKMRKQIIYSLFLTGLLLLANISPVASNAKDIPKDKPEKGTVKINSPVEERPADYIKSARAMIGKIITVNGTVKEVYKNKKNEVVIYLKDRKIPILIKCNLPNPDLQIKYPLKLGETITVKGKLTEIEDEMLLENCKIIYRSSKK